MPGIARAARHFIVEPDREQLIELGRRAGAGELNVTIDSTFALEDAAAALGDMTQHSRWLA